MGNLGMHSMGRCVGEPQRVNFLGNLPVKKQRP